MKHLKMGKPIPMPSGAITGAPLLKLLRFLPFLVVLSALIIGCGGSSPDISKPVPFPPAETSLELLKRSTGVMDTLGSFRAQMNMDGIVSGAELSVSMDIEIGDNEWAHTDMSIDTSDGRVRVEQVLTQHHAYTSFPSEDIGWMRIDLEALAESESLPTQLLTDPTGFSSSIFPAEDIPWELYSIESAGREPINGVETEHLRISVDFQELWATLNPQQQQQLGLLFNPATLGLDPEELPEQIEYKELEMWIDGSGYIRRFEMNFAVGDAVSLSMDMTIFDIGESIDVDEPDDYIELPEA